MKKGILKKAGILGLASLSLMTLSPRLAKAEKICTTHKNYYLYLLIDDEPGFVNTVYKSEGNVKNQYNSAYFPGLPKNADAAAGNKSGIIYGRICLSKDGVADGENLQCVNGITWTLEDYYRIRGEAIKSVNRETFTDDQGNQLSCRVYEKNSEDENGNKVIEHYYGGTKWFKCEDEACANQTEGGSGSNTSSLSLETLVKGSYLPSQTQITFQPANSSKAIITRTIDAKKDFLDYLTYDDDGNLKTDDEGNLIINNNSKKVVPFQLAWNAGEAVKTSLLAPAVYYVEYQTCQDEYTATINYYYYKDGKTTTDKVEFDNNEANPYVKTGLTTGSKDSYKSPEKKGCTIVDTKGNKYDTDKVVNYEIKDEDFTKNVYYYCPAEEEVETNSKTGDALIYFAWAIGLGAIGYSVYYFKKLKKEEI